MILMGVPAAEAGVKGIKGVVARVDPRAWTANAVGLTADVGRTRLPKGMSELVARQLVEDVEMQQLNGVIDANRLRAFEKIDPKYLNVEKVEVTRSNATPNHTFDIVLKSAKGDIVGHVSGAQRVMGDSLYSAMPDTEGFVSQAKVDSLGRKYVEVKPVGEKGVMFFSPQLPQVFAFDNAGKPVPSPGGLLVRINPGELKSPPQFILDSPNTMVMRLKFQDWVRSGKAEPGFYALYKAYKAHPDAPLTFEYEVVATPGTKLYFPKTTWYAKGNVPGVGEVPKMNVTSYVNYAGEGKQVSAGDYLPLYIMASEDALAAGKGVPTLREVYMGKLLGDLTALRQWAPWNLRFRPKELTESEFMNSDNPFASSFQQVKLNAVPTDKGAGRMSALIYNDKGKVLLTRAMGQDKYDLPGREATERFLVREKPERAVAKEVYEETGLKPTYVEHIDTLTAAKAAKIDVTGVTEEAGRVARRCV